jgi:hypothetical protein
MINIKFQYDSDNNSIETILDSRNSYINTVLGRKTHLVSEYRKVIDIIVTIIDKLLKKALVSGNLTDLTNFKLKRRQSYEEVAGTEVKQIRFNRPPILMVVNDIIFNHKEITSSISQRNLNIQPYVERIRLTSKQLEGIRVSDDNNDSQFYSSQIKSKAINIVNKIITHINTFISENKLEIEHLNLLIYGLGNEPVVTPIAAAGRAAPRQFVKPREPREPASLSRDHSRGSRDHSHGSRERSRGSYGSSRDRSPSPRRRDDRRDDRRDVRRDDRSDDGRRDDRDDGRRDYRDKYNYGQKYLKYKQKYLQLKKLLQEQNLI